MPYHNSPYPSSPENRERLIEAVEILRFEMPDQNWERHENHLFFWANLPKTTDAFSAASARVGDLVPRVRRALGPDWEIHSKGYDEESVWFTIEECW